MGTEHELKGNCPTMVCCLLKRNKNVELLLLRGLLKRMQNRYSRLPAVTRGFI